MENKFFDEVLDFLFETYGTNIYDYLGTTDVAFSFFANSEDYSTNSYKKLGAIKTNRYIMKDEKKEWKATIFQDYSISDLNNFITDYNECIVENTEKTVSKKFIKVVTPFTHARSYDFIIVKTEEAEEVFKLLDEAKRIKNFKLNDIPIIGIDFSELKKHTVDFLLNEEFRAFCNKHYIPLKRAIVLEGQPGCGKTLSLKYLKSMAIKNDINFRIFDGIEDFQKNKDEFYEDGKHIFVFEDFDAALLDRKETGETPNQILAKVLNILDGVNEINDVVSIFTTNHINKFDDAFLRPGRIEKVITYELPNEANKRKFIEAYLPDDSEFYDHIITFLEGASANVSYAMLKGICDDININRFSGVAIDKQLVDKVLKEKLKGANKGSEVSDSSKYVL